MVHTKVELSDSTSPKAAKNGPVDNSYHMSPDVKPRQKLNAFELLMKSSRKTPDGTSSANKTNSRPKLEPKNSVNKSSLNDSVRKNNGSPKTKTPKANRKHRSRSQSPDIETNSSLQSEQDNVEDGIIGLKVRSPNTSRCSVQESP